MGEVLQGTYWCVVWTHSRTGKRWPLYSTLASRRTDSIKRFGKRSRYERERRAGKIRCEKVVLATPTHGDTGETDE